MFHISKSLRFGFALIALQLGALQNASAQDIDPENGESYLRSSKVFPMPGYTKVQAEIRATDNFGLVRTREVQMDISGNAATRKVIARRYEPECLRLSALARMNADQVCDNLTLTGSGDRLTLAFSSIDANKRYGFKLKRDSAHPNQWQALRPSIGTAPELSLTLTKIGSAVDYVWSMSGVRNARYYQHGQLAQSWLTEAGVSDLEGSLFALGDVLNSFNAWEFEQELYPRDHPDYKPTPYSGFGEETTEGGCILNICFGNLGNSGSGGSSNNPPPNGPCDINGNNYQPELCPWDLTTATWPAPARFKIWKIDNGKVGFSYFMKNVGTGPFAADNPTVAPLGSFYSVYFTLSALWSNYTPLVPFAPNTEHPYGFQCFRGALVNADEFGEDGEFYANSLGIFSSAQFSFGGSIPPQGMAPITNLSTFMNCNKASGRPKGRYHMIALVDPSFRVDSVGHSGNNFGTSGALDYVNLKD